MWKIFSAAILLPPLPHGHPGAQFEKLPQFALGAEAAEVGDGVYLHVGTRKERLHLLHADMEDFVEDGVANRLAEPELEA